MLTPAQSEISLALTQGMNAVWVCDRQAGKTYLGTSMLMGVNSGYMVSATPSMATEKYRIYPSIVHISLASALYPQVLTRTKLIVWDDFEMYSPEQLEEVLKSIRTRNIGQFLLMASYWYAHQLRATILTEFVSRLALIPNTLVFRT